MSINLPAPPVPPDHAQPVDRLDGLSLANSICPFPHLFSRTASKNFSLIPTSPYYLPKIPTTAVIEMKVLGTNGCEGRLWVGGWEVYLRSGGDGIT